jgi:stage II sporulation protein D
MYLGLKGTYEQSDRAIRETKGVVLSYGGELISTYYHSTCGGQTASLKVWGKDPVPYLTSVLDFDDHGEPWCKKSSYSSWKKSWSLKRLNQIVKKHLKSARPDKTLPFQSLKDVKVVELFPSGRVKTLKAYTDKGNFTVSGDRTRWLFRDASNSAKILPSAWFAVGRQKGHLHISGRGFGHGIGMCQMGARGRSRAGQSYLEILTAYYQGARPVRLQ